MGSRPYPLPAFDVAAFLADGRGAGTSPTTLDLRRAAIRYLHRLAGYPMPTDNACVAEALSGIRRQAASAASAPARRRPLRWPYYGNCSHRSPPT